MAALLFIFAFSNIQWHQHGPMFSMAIISVILHSGEENNLYKRNHLAEDQPDVNHLDVRGGGKPSILLMKMVVITSMVVRFTLKAASKKKGLKKVVANVIAVRRRVGK